jgi:hypothetical protein
MKYLCLAYGAEKDLVALSKSEQEALLAQDEVLRQRGALMAAVQRHVTSVRAWDGTPTTTDGARARGWIEIRPILAINDDEPRPLRC